MTLQTLNLYLSSVPFLTQFHIYFLLFSNKLDKSKFLWDHLVFKFFLFVYYWSCCSYVFELMISKWLGLIGVRFGVQDGDTNTGMIVVFIWIQLVQRRISSLFLYEFIVWWIFNSIIFSHVNKIVNTVVETYYLPRLKLEGWRIVIPIILGFCI